MTPDAPSPFANKHASAHATMADAADTKLELADHKDITVALPQRGMMACAVRAGMFVLTVDRRAILVKAVWPTTTKTTLLFPMGGYAVVSPWTTVVQVIGL